MGLSGMKKWMQGFNGFIKKIDTAPLWWVGFLLLAATFAPYCLLKTRSVFPIHDQLDETILTYVLNAKYLGTGTEVFPELLGGVNASAMQPAAVLFIPLYKIFSPFTAFLIQYAVVFAAGFFGMYFCVKEITESSILALVAAGCFCMLPVQPVYGLSVMGAPLLLYAFLCLWQEKHMFRSLLLTAFFGLTTHLVLIGYVALGFWALALLWRLARKKAGASGAAGTEKGWRWPVLGFLLLLVCYAAVNYNLFAELILGQGSYVSHREELVNGASPFWDTVCDVFLNSAQHADSCHKYLVAPILAMLVLGGILYRKLKKKERRRYLASLAGLLVLAGIAVFYGVCRSAPVVGFKNRCGGFLHYFQADRFYWLYPAGWYLELALCISPLWGKEAGTFRIRDGREPGFGQKVLCSRLFQTAALFAALLPTLQEIKVNSYFYMNVNQINNGSGITGYISWESYYAEDLMQELEEAIGRDMSAYRVAHLGISPAPALMHGFYTADGYSNNYPLEYKHRFRRVIAKELEKAPETAVYFDTWGSRCYLFNAATGNAWMLGKDAEIVYENLEFDMDALKGLDCEYLFSCGEILNAEELGLELLGYFETESSYWGVWLYQL